MSWFYFALSAAILWGFGYTINQITLKHFTALELIFFQSLLVCIAVGTYLFIYGETGNFIEKLKDIKSFGLILASSVVYIVASIFIFKSISSSNATVASIIESCYPIFTVFFGFILFGKFQINLAAAMGVVLILCGIVLVKANS